MRQVCPLCNSICDATQPIAEFRERTFYKCGQCHLIYVHQDNLPSKKEEINRYLQHNNSIEASGYVRFLERAVLPSLVWLKPGMRGLDYGCGPEPVLSQILKNKGLDCENYDPLFWPSLPQGTFDFIFCTEAFEHFHHPRSEINRISDLLRLDGLLTIMTWFHSGSENFEKWSYIRDHTHVIFSHLDTFQYICREWNFSPLWDDGDRVIILKKMAEKQNKWKLSCD
ncbi:class I SAM-dependent methyltransferase [Thermophagus sp. OGC60D27]|uniref:class I SAM-dependent methyltransferase n=1 Tax=Thermophagus sp. OGC60D27 TaxID=3458415 RepID=UPI0040382EF3